jgi:hypothetical protein
VHNPHTTAAEFLDDAVVRDGLSDHWSRILRGQNGRVNESDGVGGGSRGLLLRRKKGQRMMRSHG